MIWEAFILALGIGGVFVLWLGCSIARAVFLDFRDNWWKPRVVIGMLLGLMLFASIAGMVGHMMLFRHLGGSTTNGKIVGERYYVGNHGRYSEVTRGEYYFSYHYSRISWRAYVGSFLLLGAYGF